MTASHSLSVLRKEYLGFGIVSSMPFWVVASQDIQIIFISSATGPRASPTALEMPPLIMSTLFCKASFRNRSVVSFGFVSSSMNSSIFRPRMPPAALMRSTPHWKPRIPTSPTVAATPLLIGSTPILTGLAWAKSGARFAASIASRPPMATAADPVSFRKVRRVVCMCPPVSSRGCWIVTRFILEAIDQRRSRRAFSSGIRSRRLRPSGDSGRRGRRGGWMRRNSSREGSIDTLPRRSPRPWAPVIVT